jgi:hypothetical protein
MNMNVNDSSRASSAANLVVGAVAAHVGFSLLSMMLVGLVMRAMGPETWFTASQFVWMAIDGFLAFALFQLAAQVREEDAAGLRLAGVAVVGSIVFDLVQFGLNQANVLPSAANSIVSVLNVAINVATKGVLLYAFARIAGKTQAWILPVAGVVALIVLLRSGISVASILHVLSPEARRGVLMTVLMPGLSLVSLGGLFAVAFGVRQAVIAAPQSEAIRAAAGLQAATAPEPVSPAADFLIGGILLAVGIGVSVVSYSSASGGGRYVVATGAIGVGVGRILRGIIRAAKGNPAA